VFGGTVENHEVSQRSHKRRLISRQVTTDPTDWHPKLSCADTVTFNTRWNLCPVLRSRHQNIGGGG